MKTLSIRQPWANLIVHGIKDIENRSWRTSYRGRVLVHAPAKVETPVFTIQQVSELCSINLSSENDDVVLPMEAIVSAGWGIGVLTNIETSAIIGSVEIVNCVKGHWSPWAERGFWNWVLKNPVLFDQPILGVKGKLSFWEYTIGEDK